MKLIKALLLSIVIVSLVGCANARKLNEVELGMTKSQVITKLGEPDTTAAQGKTQYLIYNLYATDNDISRGITSPYFVKFVNGIVDSYGLVGDFDSTKSSETTSTVNLNINKK